MKQEVSLHKKIIVCSGLVILLFPVSLSCSTSDSTYDLKSTSPSSPTQYLPLVTPAGKVTLKLLFWDPDTVAKVRQDIRSGAPGIQPAVKQLQNDAKWAVTKEASSVMDKKGIPPSGSKHDYMSLSIYYWPDPNSADGKPYVYRDGETNPESDIGVYDKAAISSMVSCVRTLSYAYYFLDDRASGDRAAFLLRTWFINPATCINPNMEYAQGVPGKSDGSPSGIIESVILLDIVDAAAFIADCPSWTIEDQNALKKWFRDYVTWLQNSRNGKREALAKNNHGTWYDAQVAAYSLFADDIDIVFTLLKSSVPERIASQIEPDGRQPLELARTRSLKYSVYNLEAFISLALLGDHFELDLWNYSTNDGRSIRKALDFVIPYINGKEWPHQQIMAEKFNDFAPFLRRAMLRYREKDYAAIADKLLGDKLLSDRINLLCPR